MLWTDFSFCPKDNKTELKSMAKVIEALFIELFFIKGKNQIGVNGTSNANCKQELQTCKKN